MDSRKPPDLPPRPTGSPSRRLPPELPPRPGVPASPVRPDRHDWPSDAGNLDASSNEQSSASSLSSLLLLKSSSAPAAPLSGSGAYLPIISQEGSTSASAMQQPVDIPEIVHTAASSPELDSHPRFPPSRGSSNGSMHSIASSNGSNPRRAEPHSSQSHRPVVNLYGTRSAEEHYHEALEELQALEVVRTRTRVAK